MKTMAKKVKVLLCSCLVCLATLLGCVFFTPVTANAATLSDTQFQTNGSSVRVLSWNGESYEETGRKGIRFHVETGAGYKANGTTLLDTATINERNGSFKVADGLKTYTIILPTRLLSGELTVNTANIMKLDTTEYWYADNDGNWESVAYIYNVPTHRYSDNFSFRGVVCSVDANGNETVVSMTDVAERNLTWVAKQSYVDTINPDSAVWGSPENDDIAAPLIKKFIPTYTITYNVNGVETTEEVLWGDKPVNAPAFEVEDGGHIVKEATWYDTEHSEEVDITKAMTWTENRTLVLNSTTSADFKLTGIADLNNFNVAGTNYNGAKIYATIPAGDFYSDSEVASGTEKMLAMDAEAVNVVYEGTGTFSGLQGVWTLMEGKGNGAQLRLVFAFDSSAMNSGDKIIVKGDSAFYANGVMYKLTEDYTIDYTKVGGVEDYGMFLGYLYNSDVKSMENWVEPTDETRKRIRVTFYDDLLINSNFKFVFDGALPAGYTYPVYTKCNDTGTETQITEGYYYWNDGEHTILELNGHAYHNNDELFGAPGTKIVQNGGYYIFEEAMYAYYNGTNWVVGAEKGTFGVNAFEVVGKNFTDGTQEVRLTTNGNTQLVAGGTTNRWFDDVRQMNVENMSHDEPYAVYHTAVDGTKTELKGFTYHGQANGNSYHHIFAIRDIIGSQAGETITIIGGTRFWYANEYFTATEDIILYYNGANWIVNNDGTADATATADIFAGHQGYNYYEANRNNVRLHAWTELFNGQTGSLYVESGSVKVNGIAYNVLHYHGNGNKIFEIRGDNTKKIGEHAFSDTLIIEAGTRLWIGQEAGSKNVPYCVEFTEMVEWRYVGQNMTDGSRNVLPYEWIICNNTNITKADVVRMYNATDAGGEVRISLSAGILTNDFYGFMAVDYSKGVPVVNGSEMYNESFAYGQANKLIAVRGGQYGINIGDYIIIPKGSVWWTSQGSLTFAETICGVFDGGNWRIGFNADAQLTPDVNEVERLYNDGANEVRVQIPRGISDTYYGPFMLDGEAYVTKANGTKISSRYGYWYGGNSSYQANHSLIGFQANGISNNATGDVFTVKAGSKIILTTGYHVVEQDIVYTYVDGAWKAGDLSATTTFTASNASVSGVTSGIVGKSYTFTVTPNSGYAIYNVTVNGKAVSGVNNVYTYVAEKTNEVVVETISTASAYTVTFVVDNGVTVNGGAIINGTEEVLQKGDTIHFTVAVNSGYRLDSVVGASDNGDGTYTLTPTDNTTVTITTVKVWTVSYTLNESTASIFGQTVTSGSSLTVDEGKYNVTIKANSGYAITSVTNATNNMDGTYTVNVNGNLNIVVATKQAIQLNASAINSINVYDETSANPTCMGVRMSMNATAFQNVNKIVYGLNWNGSVSSTVNGSVYHSSVFNAPHNFFELRFDTTNLKVGDSFTIKAGTVFYHNDLSYAIEWTEDIVGEWSGSQWILNPEKIGELDWSNVNRVISYSDIVNGAEVNHTIRIFFTEEIFDVPAGTPASVAGTITINGNPYTGRLHYHGAGNKIFEISEWNYARNQKLVIAAGTKIFVGNQYYLVTKTLTATCSANGNEATWRVSVS